MLVTILGCVSSCNQTAPTIFESVKSFCAVLAGAFALCIVSKQSWRRWALIKSREGKFAGW